tara:strand:- start:681 stop:1913 length:1233 start_codon:yes stop_codon:yes gene_type:complete
MMMQELIHFYYAPQPMQKLFHADRYRVKFRLVSAGTGGGKTLAGVFECVSWCLENAGTVGYIYEPTYAMVRRILIPAMESEWIFNGHIGAHPLVREYSRGDKRIEFINDSVLWFGSLEDPETAEGPNIDFAHIDEARLVRHFDSAWRTVRRRLRGSRAGNRIGAWITTTPDHPNSALYKSFEDSRSKLDDSMVYRWSLMENTMLPQGFIDDMLQAHTGGLSERFIHGRFAEVGAGSFEFDSTQHIIGSIDKENMRQVAYGVDFGWTNPATIIAIGIDGDGRAYILDEFYKSQASDEELVAGAQELQSRWGAGRFYCDSSEPRMIEKFRKSGLDARGNKSKRDDGIREVGGRLRTVGDGKPRLFIHQDCVNTISEFQVYDADVKANDHCVDATRYGLMGLGNSKNSVWVGR